MDTILLHDLVASQISQQWDAWAQAHPHLAAAIDQTRLTEAAVARLRDDPEFTSAMAQATSDGDTLADGALLAEFVKNWVARLLLI